MYARSYYTGDGTTTDFAVSFPYMDQSHVKVLIDGNSTGIPPVWLNSGTIRISPAPANQAQVLVYRETPRDSRMVVYQDGNYLPATDLNTTSIQSLYIEQEILDEIEATFVKGLTEIQPSPYPVDPDTLLQAITQNILQSQLYLDLQSTLNSIDVNGQTIADHTNMLSSLDTTVTNQTNELATHATDIANNSSAIATEQTARSDGDTQLAQLIALIGAKSTDGTAFIFDASTAKVDATTTLTDKFSGMLTSIGDNQAAITNEVNTRTSQYNTLSQQINTLSATSNQFYVQDTAPTGANVGDVWYDSSNGNHPYRWDGTQWVDIQDQTITTLESEYSSEQTARIAGDNALASDIALLGAANGTGDAFLLDSASCQITFGGSPVALVDQINTLATQIGNNSSAIQTEQTARASGDSANASSITTLQTTVDGNTSSIQTNASSINGLSSEYFVKLDTNGYVTGFGVYNSASSSEFVVLVDKFAIVTPGDNPTVPFVVGTVNGTTQVGIHGDLIVDGTIRGNSLALETVTADRIAVGTITGDRIKAGTITADRLNVTNLAAVSASLGTVVGGIFKTAASGYRTEIGNTAFPIWYGTGSVSAANANFYLDNAGDAFFKGTVNSTYITGSLVDPWSLRLNCGGGRLAAVMVYSCSNYNGATTSVTLPLGQLVAPDYGSGLMANRLIDHVMDVFVDVQINGDLGSETVKFQVSVDGGAWQNIHQQTNDLNYRGSMTMRGRYTTPGTWNTLDFQVITTSGHTQNASVSLTTYNFLASANAAGSADFGAGGGGTGGGSPPGGGGGGGGVLY